jgi:hypothetical protein
MSGQEAPSRPPEGGGQYLGLDEAMLSSAQRERENVGTAWSTAADYREVIPENILLESMLHTLLLSFPKGTARDSLLTRVPEVSPQISVRQGLRMPEIQRIKCRELLGRVSLEIGSSEMVQFLLNYPGLTQDEPLTMIRPVREAWLQTSLDANTLAPQTGEGVKPRLGYRVMGDIARGVATWEDVVFAYLNRDQLEREKESVSKFHMAFRAEPAMPTGYNHPKYSYIIPDALIQAIWRSEIKNVVMSGLTLADWVEVSGGVQLPPASPPMEGQEVVKIDSRNAARLQAVFSESDFTPYVNAYLSLYQVAITTLASEEGRLWQQQQRAELNTRRGVENFGVPASQLLTALIREAVSNRVDHLRGAKEGIRVPDNLHDVFVGLVTGKIGITPKPPLVFD